MASATLSVMASFSPPGDQRKRRGVNTSPDAEVVALSPETLLATNRFWCDLCEKGFLREQNLQLHRRGHNLPGKLKQKTSHGIQKKKVYICPEMGCVHHDPSRALGDITGIKKHFFRKHCEKKFSCDNCNKKYAVHSDLKAHSKTCTKKFKCECGATFPRPESFTYHRSICDVLTEKVARHPTDGSPYSSMTASVPANADSVIPGSHHQLTTPLLGQGASSPFSFTSLLTGKSTESAFQPIQPPSMPLHPARKNSFRELMTNATLVIKSMGSSSSVGMKFNSHAETLGDGMSGGGGIRGGPNLEEMYNNWNVGGGSYGSAGGYGGGVEHVSNQMNAPYEGMMFNVNNADRMGVGHEANNNALGDPQMNESEDRDTVTRDFLGMGFGMNSLSTGGGMGG